MRLLWCLLIVFVLSVEANEVKEGKDGDKKADPFKEPALDPDALARVTLASTRTTLFFAFR